MKGIKQLPSSISADASKLGASESVHPRLKSSMISQDSLKFSLVSSWPVIPLPLF